MIAYTIFQVLAFLFSLSRKHLVLAFAFLFLVIGTRYQVGVDWTSYYSFSKSIEAIDILHYRAPLYYILSFPFLPFPLRLYLSNIILAIISLAGLFTLIRRYPYPSLSLSFSFLPIVLVLFTGLLKQGIATSFLLFALSALDQRLYKASLIASVLAFLVHPASLFVISLYLFFTHLTLTIKKVKLIALSIPFLYLIGYLITISPLFAYLIQRLDPSWDLNPSGLVPRLIIFSFFCLLYLSLRMLNSIIHPLLYQLDPIFKSLAFIILMSLTFPPLSFISDRLLYFYIPFTCVLPSLVTCSLHPRSLPYTLFFLFSVLITALWFLFSPHSYTMLPYNTILNSNSSI